MKTESKHTPGPWRVGDAGNTVFGPPNGNPSPETVATIHGGTSDQAAVTRVFIMRANARLIAAAPELKTAVSLTLKMFMEFGTEWMVNASPSSKEAFDKCLSAISKTEVK